MKNSTFSYQKKTLETEEDLLLRNDQARQNAHDEEATTFKITIEETAQSQYAKTHTPSEPLRKTLASELSR